GAVAGGALRRAGVRERRALDGRRRRREVGTAGARAPAWRCPPRPLRRQGERGGRPAAADPAAPWVVVAAASSVVRLAGCKPARSGVLGRPNTEFGIGAPCVLGSLDFRAARRE